MPPPSAPRALSRSTRPYVSWRPTWPPRSPRSGPRTCLPRHSADGCSSPRGGRCQFADDFVDNGADILVNDNRDRVLARVRFLQCRELAVEQGGREVVAL